MSEVPAPLPGRPFYVSVDGGKVYVSVHDAFHLERERDFKRRIRLAHPDGNHHRWACSRTRRLLQARRQFQAEEARWYASYGLEPPHGAARLAGGASRRSGPPLPLPSTRTMPSGLILDYVGAGPPLDGPARRSAPPDVWPEAA